MSRLQDLCDGIKHLSTTTELGGFRQPLLRGDVRMRSAFLAEFRQPRRTYSAGRTQEGLRKTPRGLANWLIRELGG